MLAGLERGSGAERGLLVCCCGGGKEDAIGVGLGEWGGLLETRWWDDENQRVWNLLGLVRGDR